MKLIKILTAFIALASLQITAAQWLNVPPPAEAKNLMIFTAGVPVVATGIEYVASSIGSNAVENQNMSIAFGASTQSGDLLVVAIALADGTEAVPDVGAGTFRDNRSNTWTLVYEAPSANSTSMNIGFYTAIATDSGTVTITSTLSTTRYQRGVVMAFRNATGGGAVDDTAQVSASSTNPHAGTITPTGRAVIFGFVRIMSGASTVTPDAEWTLCAENETNSNVMSGCYVIVDSGNYDYGWTLGTSGWHRSATIALK